jgi:uncharacterized membrane protein
MKKIGGVLLAFSLVLVLTSMAQAANCEASQGCVDVEIAVLPTAVCPGESITVMGWIKNCGNCRDIFRVWVKLDIAGDETFSGHRRCVCPKITIPLDGNAELKFNYESRIPRIVPPGDYTITIYATGVHSGAEDQASDTFTVLPCLTP